jgi:hypothetical protein
MDNPLVMQILLGVLVLLALVFGGLSAKTWRAWDVVGGFLVFLGAVIFLVLLATSLKARRHWMKTLDQYEKEYTQVTSEQEKLLYGDLTEAVQTEESLRSITAKLSRFMLDRGRIWRESVPAPPAGDGTITVSIAGATAEAPHQIPQNFVLYAFRDVPLADGRKVPAAYIGEFQVVAASPTNVQIRPTLLSPQLLAASSTSDFANRFVGNYIQNATWSLYELLPTDDHRTYTDPEVQPDLKVEGAPVFGAVNEGLLQEAFANVLQVATSVAQTFGTPVPNQAAIEQIVQRRLRDGRRAEPDDPPSETYLKVEFVQQHEEKVDSDVAQAVLNSNFFDSQGQAQVDFLRRGDDGTVTLQPGAVIVLPQEPANQLIRDGICKLVEPIFVRQLTDYTRGLQANFNRLVETQLKIRDSNYNMAQITAANQRISNLIQVRQDERNKVDADLKQVTYERDQVQMLVQKLQAALDKTKDEIRGLLSTNLSLEQDLSAIHQRIRDVVDQAGNETAAR